LGGPIIKSEKKIYAIAKEGYKKGEGSQIIEGGGKKEKSGRYVLPRNGGIATLGRWHET
jgi:hypothetical protein